MSDRKSSLPLLQLRTALVLRVREFQAYYADVVGSKNSSGKHNILIYGQGRSGTTLFEHLMVSTGCFSGYHEVLNKVTREVLWPTAYVRGLGRRIPTENVILHVKPEHLVRARKRPVEPRVFLESLVEDGWFIVHIQRRDVIRQMVSKYLAKARGAYHKADDEAEELRLELPVQEFLEKYERRRNLLADECLHLEGLPHQRLYYEDHLEKPECHQQTIDKILDILGLDSRPVSTRLKKIAKSSVEDHVSNIDDLRMAFESRGLKWTL